MKLTYTVLIILVAVVGMGLHAGYAQNKDTPLDPIDTLITTFSNNDLWANGSFPKVMLPKKASPKEVLQALGDSVKNFKILKTKQVSIPTTAATEYTAALVDTDRGQKIVLFRYEGPTIGWWSRAYEIK